MSTKLGELDLATLNEQTALVRVIKEMDCNNKIWYIVQKKIRGELGFEWQRCNRWVFEVDADSDAQNLLESIRREKFRKDFNENALKNPKYFI